MPPYTVPAPCDLRDWLECAVTVNDGAAGAAHARFPAMVSGMLVVRLAGQVWRGGEAVPPAALIGASTRATVYEQQGRVHAVGLVLRPEALGALFAPAACPLTNRIVPLTQALGAPWAAVEHAVRTAPDDAARLAALWDSMRRAVTALPGAEARRRHLQGLAEAASGDARVPAAGSLRQWQRRFQAGFGMSPKQFQVISRLNRTLRHATALGRADAHLIAQQGYYDQSHMARDMRRLAGRPLQALVAATQAGPSSGEHWPLRVGAQAAAFEP